MYRAGVCDPQVLQISICVLYCFCLTILLLFCSRCDSMLDYSNFSSLDPNSMHTIDNSHMWSTRVPIPVCAVCTGFGWYGTAIRLITLINSFDSQNLEFMSILAVSITEIMYSQWKMSHLNFRIYHKWYNVQHTYCFWHQMCIESEREKYSTYWLYAGRGKTFNRTQSFWLDLKLDARSHLLKGFVLLYTSDHLWII